MIVKPKKKRNHMPSHILTKEQTKNLNKYRNRIELLNGQIRRSRGINIKHVKKIKTFDLFLRVKILCITCYNLFVHVI